MSFGWSRVLAAAVLVGGSLGISAIAAPLVVGFERFHSSSISDEGGRLLFNELGCVNCHGGDTGLPARRGPELTNVTQTETADWLRDFLLNPSSARNGTSMPHLLAPNDSKSAEAIVHYLASLNTPRSKAKDPKHVNAKRGRALYHSLGCVSCHAPEKDFSLLESVPEAKDFTYPSVEFPELQRKYSLQSLSEFLKEPLKTRTDGRMPRTLMTEDDAVDLAGYLLGFEDSDGTIAKKITPLKPDPQLVGEGLALVRALKCASCHNLPKSAAAPFPVSIKTATGGCMTETPSSSVPQYRLGQKQRQALLSFLERRDSSLNASRLTSLQLESLNCAACHERSGIGGPDAGRKAYFQGDHNLGDTGRFPPPLTEIGRKLQPEWLEKVLAGELRVRPYLSTKMPVFGAATKGLAAQFALTDAQTERPMPGGDDTAGRKLLGTVGGLGCITCHRWGARPALGVQALDLSQIGQRLQLGWLREYLIDPAAHRPGTLMPSFWPSGKASNTVVLAGDTDRQIASIYSFAKSANGEPEGFPANQSGEFELVPKDRPLVQRTFMEGVGTHAILVGFPAGVHLAYDGKHARPAMAWKGGFFDAYTTWFSRFAPFEKPLGNAVVHWPVAAGNSPAVRFEGYTLDVTHTPIFRFSIADVLVEERFEGLENKMRRTLVWDSTKLDSPPIAHPEEVSVLEEPGSAPGRRIFIYQWK